ncbi:MAG: DUF503 domain-containing protein [Thermoanaerobaculia bacterium]|nr:DUF503 domain-containing protein [Thermoanaerobaculia bacterium]
MLIGLTTFEIHLPHSRSLKEKRRVVKGVVDRIHDRYRVSVLESDHHDLLQRTQISVVMAARDESEIDRIMTQIRTVVDHRPEGYVTLWNERILEGLE